MKGKARVDRKGGEEREEGGKEKEKILVEKGRG